MSHRIPWAHPSLVGSEEEFVVDALRSTWISGGPYVDRLERDVARLCERAHAVSAANGTAAIHMAYLALGLEPGDEVIVPAFCFLAAANIALHMGLTPVFADVDPDSWCLDPASAESALTERTRCIVAVHTYGNVCELDVLDKLARRHSVSLLEDAAEAFGSTYRGRPAGSTGRIGTLSFQATKTITSGEGGMVLTDEPEAAELLRLYRNHGMDKRRYLHEVPGHNFRLTNLQAALACAQLEHIEEIAAERGRVTARYASNLSDAEGIRLQEPTAGAEPLTWVVGARLDPSAFEGGRDTVMERMDSRGIETRPGFYSPHEMSIYDTGPLPVAAALSREVISLPTYPSLSDATVDEICDALIAARRP